MSRRPRRTESPRPQLPTTSSRGISAADVDRAADALLDAWWSRLAGRLDAGPAAFHRLLEPVLLAVGGLWLQTLDEARKRATAEQGSRKASLARDVRELDVRAHVLIIRESEFKDRIAQAEGRKPVKRNPR